ncbi:uncharacterized protein KLLA0_F17028g [Kluyveromyces lactis]|uniref:KLLA0F17028p n=1 Tax=Kluyveromyces lactis (strain ATCC 8585 / CBS 2359 / DSM 70799 / NBRC 1267 / NRRL Y-1140 / WM37) TaxID=284590 RepID=Q6CJP4_KLULA|nr:uncharacterized protein KLLA0_F17028g [Kluyveromyces lactis]CAG98553.1 KLLA0F17028p [Kluyveromyces lactis]|eukprot:XP_455845.1 uncharacterized protein KLLA0_F17028g [Kluyveromyces lactis]
MFKKIRDKIHPTYNPEGITWTRRKSGPQVVAEVPVVVDKKTGQNGKAKSKSKDKAAGALPCHDRYTEELDVELVVKQLSLEDELKLVHDVAMESIVASDISSPSSSSTTTASSDKNAKHVTSKASSTVPPHKQITGNNAAPSRRVTSMYTIFNLELFFRPPFPIGTLCSICP